METKEWPVCRQCSRGVLIPLSDYGPHGGDIPFKVWVCHNPDCGFSLRIDKGQVSAEHVAQSSSPAQRKLRK